MRRIDASELPTTMVALSSSGSMVSLPRGARTCTTEGTPVSRAASSAEERQVT